MYFVQNFLIVHTLNDVWENNIGLELMLLNNAAPDWFF